MHTKTILITGILGLALTPLFSFASELPNNSATTTITLRIETATSTLWNADVTFAPCSPSGTGTGTPNGFCAVQATGLNTIWSAFGDDKFLESVEGKANDFVTGAYWGWFSNETYGQTALTSHTTEQGETLLLTLGIMPLKVVIASSTVPTGSTTTVSAFEFGFDSNWNGVWTPSASSTIYIGNELLCTTETNGTCELISPSGTTSIAAAKLGFATSSPKIISPARVTSDPEPVQTVSGSGSSGATRTDSSTAKTVNVSHAIEFIYSGQQTDGSFSNALYDDWVALALSGVSNDNRKDKLVSFMRSSSPNLSSVTDYERHAMALMSLGINPYSGTSIDCISHIIQAFDGNQIGDANLVNDDVFAIFPLLKVGYDVNDEIIYKTGINIIDSQRNDGSWNGSIDMTSAAVAALSQVQTISGTQAALSKARTYLLERQQADGGFGSTFSTSWVVQAITALGENATSWKSSAGKNPLDSLAASQAEDGGLEYGSSQGTRIWATSYMIPSVLNRSWFSLLSSFAKQSVSVAQTGTTAQEQVVTHTELATTTSTELPLVKKIEVIEPAVVKEPVALLKKINPEPVVSQNLTASDGPGGSVTEETGNPSLAAVGSVSVEDPVLPQDNIPLNVAIGVIAVSGIAFLIIKI